MQLICDSCITHYLQPSLIIREQPETRYDMKHEHMVSDIHYLKDQSHKLQIHLVQAYNHIDSGSLIHLLVQQPGTMYISHDTIVVQ